MTSIRTLPKSLVTAASEVVSNSEKAVIKIRSRLYSEGLKKFGVSDKNQLTESQLKALHSWVQIKLDEAACGCDEDDMPGDAPYHKGGDEDAEKKKELDEGEAAQSAVDAELKKLGKTLGELSPEEKKDLFNRVDARVDAKNEASDDDIYEGVSLDADEIATNGAVGVTDAEEQLPVHADVLRDSSPVDGKTELRLFVQFNTNTLPVIVPPVTLPGAPTLDALRDIVESLPFFCDVCERALAAAADLPHESPSHAGENVTEAYVPTAYDKKVISTIKQALKKLSETPVQVEVKDTISKGLHKHEFVAALSVPGNPFPGTPDLRVKCHEQPSKKTAGKMVWAIRTAGDEFFDFPKILSEPYSPGMEQKSLAALKAALSKVGDVD
jgi:hypothetical protein